ncbi:hypothetical protein Hanom_Chr16g01442151 [Helianthus anomalus]
MKTDSQTLPAPSSFWRVRRFGADGDSATVQPVLEDGGRVTCSFSCLLLDIVAMDAIDSLVLCFENLEIQSIG